MIVLEARCKMKFAYPIQGILISSRTWAPCGAVILSTLAAGAAEEYFGPCALAVSKDGKTLHVAGADARQVAWVELPGGRVTRRVRVPAEATGLVLSPDGTRLIVTCAAPKSTIVVMDSGSGEVRAAIPAGHTATGPAVTPDGNRLYVCNRFDGDVSVIDLAAGKELTRVKVVREPVAAAATPDGKTVLVANHLPDDRTDVLYTATVSAMVTFIDVETSETTGVRLPMGSHSLRGVCVSPDGKHGYASHILSNFELVPSQLDQGWMNINAISVVDIPGRKWASTVGLDEAFLGAGNPWGVACISDGRSIAVSHAGSHELSLVDATALLGQLRYVFISSRAAALPEDPPSGNRLRQRIKLPGKGPRGLAIHGSKVYVAEYFSDTVAVLDLQGEGGGPPGSIALGDEPQLTLRRRGEILFNDATICYQRWQSCASCHPDGRTDAINWDLMNDGVGNFKNTRSMLLAHETPPAMAEGVRATAELAVRTGLQYILFADRPEDEAAAIHEYMKSLKPVPSPRLVDGRLSPAAERGKKIFESERIGCTKCHPAPLYTDLKMHDVASKSPYEYKDSFDTPTLIEVWRTAPYLHDGRYRTMKEVYVQGKHGNGMGPVDELTEQEIDDLVEFVLSL